MTRRLGPYAPLSATYSTDDAIIEAGEGPELLYVRGLAFCAASESDGFITLAQLKRFVGAGMDDVTGRAKTLVEVGLWEEEEGGFFVRAWLKWNKSAEEIGRAKRKDRERKAAKKDEAFQPDDVSDVDADNAAESSGHSDRIPDGFQAEARSSSDRIPGGIQKEGGPESGDDSDRTPDGFQPRAGAREARASGGRAPDSLHSTPQHNNPPNPPGGKPGSRRAAYDYGSDPDFATFWKAFPEKEGKPSAFKAWQSALQRGMSPDDLITAARAYALDLKRNPRKPKYPQGWLNDERYRRYLPELDEDKPEQTPADDNPLLPPWEA